MGMPLNAHCCYAPGRFMTIPLAQPLPKQRPGALCQMPMAFLDFVEKLP
jgi:hypothetical protein